MKAKVRTTTGMMFGRKKMILKRFAKGIFLERK